MGEVFLQVIACILIIMLAGCNSNSDFNYVHGNNFSETSEITEETTRIKTEIVEAPNNTSPSNIDINSIDYNQYLKKIWVVDSWDGGAYSDSFSFVITKIESDVIEGKISTGAIVTTFYIHPLNQSKHLGDLSGTIYNGVAECHFRDENGNKGKVTLTFKENDKIDAVIKYTSKAEYYAKESLDGSFSFKPYNLADIQVLVVDEELSFKVNLNSWGDVHFVSGKIPGHKPYPNAYLTNDQNDILYEFGAPYQVASEILDVSIEDITGDGLKDVKIITYFPILPDAIRIEWIFNQLENGLFYNSGSIIFE